MAHIIDRRKAEQAERSLDGLLSGNYLLRVREVKADSEARSSNGKYMPTVQFEVLEPKDFAGRRHTHRFVLGTDDDPDGTDGPGLGLWTRMCVKAGVGIHEDIESMGELVEGQEVGAKVVAKVEPELRRDGSTNEYAGQVRPEIRDFMAPGEFVPEVFTPTTESSSPARSGGLRSKLLAGTKAPTDNGASGKRLAKSLGLKTATVE